MRYLLLSILLTATAISTEAAPVIYETGHADLRPGAYDPITKSFQPGWHFDTGLFEHEVYAADGAVARISSQRPAPTGAAAVFGTTGNLYVAGSALFQPNLGFATGGLNPADWEKVNFGEVELPAIMATLTDWSGPGEFALYTTNVSGTTFANVFFSTFDADATDYDNTLEIIIPDHQHYIWGFTAPGVYELTITWWGNHVTDGLIETEATYRFEVIPEPSTLVLLALTATSMLGLKLRRRE